jgi:hypothetical protein
VLIDAAEVLTVLRGSGGRSGDDKSRGGKSRRDDNSQRDDEEPSV